MPLNVERDLTLASGKNFSEENLDLNVLMNIRNIPRGYMYSGVPPHDNFTGIDHAIGCYIIGTQYWKWLEEKDNNEILQAFPKSLIEKWGGKTKYMARAVFLEKILTHDFSEVVTGDVVPNLKTREFKEAEHKIQRTIESYLGIQQLPEESEAIIYKHLKIIDLLQSMWEIKQLLPKYPSVERIYGMRLKRLSDFVELDEIQPFAEQIGAYSKELWTLPDE